MSSVVALADFLIVQDDPADEMFVRDALDLHKVCNRVYVVPSARRAIAFIERAAPYSDVPVPDVVLLDLNLPGVNGRQFLRYLRTGERTADIPILLLVDSPAAEQILRAEELPVQGYAIKPIDFGRLAGIVRQVPRLAFTVLRSRRPAGRLP
jgi:CheY-like chemotaxis protein